MTSQDRKKVEWLSRYRHICNRIFCKLDEEARWMSIATKITPTMSDMPKAQSNSSKIETAVEKIDEIKEQIQQEIGTLMKERAEIEATIQSLPSERDREIFERKYIRGQYWEQIAVDMHYEYHYLVSLHSIAIKSLHIENIINNHT